MNNNDARGNNWLKIRTEGTESNPDGIGARVTVSVDGASGPVFKE